MDQNTTSPSMTDRESFRYAGFIPVTGMALVLSSIGITMLPEVGLNAGTVFVLTGMLTLFPPDFGSPTVNSTLSFENFVAIITPRPACLMYGASSFNAASA